MIPDLSNFHFAQPLWLLALLVPALIWLWQRLTVPRARESHIERYADRELLPHLVSYSGLAPQARRRRLLLWSLLWSLCVVAMAGPRWDFADISLFRPGSDLVILLDLSRSMEVADVMPSRLGRARQEIEDLLEINPSLRIGVIAFASVAHVVAPITEDRDTINRVLPEISTDLVRFQGSRLSSALDRAERLLLGQGGQSTHAMLLISDGDFVESGLEEQIKRMASQGMYLHVLGIGTEQGAKVPAPERGWVRDSRGRIVISRLNEDLLQELADAGGGLYREANYRDDDIRSIVEELMAQAPMQEGEERDVRIWHERFYWLTGLVLLLLLPWFRKTKILPTITSAKQTRKT